MNKFLKITLNFLCHVHPAINPSIGLFFRPGVHILGDGENVLTLSYNFDPQLLIQRLCVLFIFALCSLPPLFGLLWNRNTYSEDKWGTTGFVCPPYSERPSLKRVINAVSYSLSPAWHLITHSCKHSQSWNADTSLEVTNKAKKILLLNMRSGGKMHVCTHFFAYIIFFCRKKVYL